MEGHLFEWTECPSMEGRELPYKGGMPIYGIVTPFMCTIVRPLLAKEYFGCGSLHKVENGTSV